MPKLEDELSKLDAQVDFSGGMKMVGELAPNQYRYAENVIVRDGPVETRPGFRRAFRVAAAGFNKSFYFNQDNARFNDAGHTGFWFPFTFVGSAWGNIQGVAFFRFMDETEVRQLVVSDGDVFIHRAGYVEEIATADSIADDEVIRFVQANNWLIMFRSGGNQPMYWDGADKDAGFQLFTNAGQTNRIPLGSNGFYMHGRLWVFDGRDDIAGSDALDFDTYDEVSQLFSVNRGDGDELVAGAEFKKDYGLVWKKRSTYYLSGVNEFIDVAEGDTLAAHVKIERISNTVGAVGPRAFAFSGEDAYFFSFKGVVSVFRTAEGAIMGNDDRPLSADIQPLIDRINWQHADGICMAVFNNYLLCAVPLDENTTNHHVLVYDFLANSGRGAWVSLWTSAVQAWDPVEFFVRNEQLYVLSEDGALRIMFSDDPWDSEDVFDDTPRYDNSVYYKEGVYVFDDGGGVEAIYKSIEDNIAVDVTDATVWEMVEDPYALYHVVSEFWTRFYDFGDRLSGKVFGACQLDFEHVDPYLSVYIEDEDFNKVRSLFEGIEYNRRRYDVADKRDWDPTNFLLDFNDPDRQDYALFCSDDGVTYDVAELAELFSVGRVGELFTVEQLIFHGIPVSGEIDGIFADEEGLLVGSFENHSLRFYPRTINNRAFALRIKNERGTLRLRNVGMLGNYTTFANRDR